jgi:hypothetical protein
LTFDLGFGPDGDLESGFSILRKEPYLHPDVGGALRQFCGGCCCTTEPHGGGGRSFEPRDGGPDYTRSV